MKANNKDQKFDLEPFVKDSIRSVEQIEKLQTELSHSQQSPAVNY